MPVSLQASQTRIREMHARNFDFIFEDFLSERLAMAPLLAEASVGRGVEVIVTEIYLNKEASSGCHARLVRCSY
jgi:hypothetical protein